MMSSGSTTAGSAYSRCRRKAAPLKGDLSRGKLRRRPTHQQANMKPPHNKRPGSTPATNSDAMEALAVRANRIKGIDGGIRMSIVAAAASVAAENAAG